MTEAQLALLADTRLSARARLAALYLSEIEGSDEQAIELPSSVFEGLLGKSWDVLRPDLRALERAGWVERKANTGRGHSPGYRFLAYAKSPPFQELRVAFLHTLNFGIGETATLNADGMGKSATLNAPTSTTSIPPPPPPLDARAREFIAERESLVDTRKPLLDYVTEKVDPGKHLAYVHTVAGIIEESDERLWMARDGSYVHEGRAKIVSGCLNELRQGHEVGRYFPGPPGDIANLQSKIRYKVRSITDAKRDAERKREAGATRDQATTSGRARGSFL